MLVAFVVREAGSSCGGALLTKRTGITGHQDPSQPDNGKADDSKFCRHELPIPFGDPYCADEPSLALAVLSEDIGLHNILTVQILNASTVQRTRGRDPMAQPQQPLDDPQYGLSELAHVVRRLLSSIQA